MEDLFKIVGAFVTMVATVSVVSVATGTLLWLVYSTSIPMLFPSAVENGILAADLTWWQFVKVAWVFGVLIKSSNTNNNK